jgi:hypothetical protein
MHICPMLEIYYSLFSTLFILVLKLLFFKLNAYKLQRTFGPFMYSKLLGLHQLFIVGLQGGNVGFYLIYGLVFVCMDGFGYSALLSWHKKFNKESQGL